MKVGLPDSVYVDERKNIIVDALGDNEGWKFLCWCIRSEKGAIINK
jgi:hypothetical protein